MKEELSFAEAVNRLKNIFLFFWSYKWWFIASVLIGSLLGALYFKTIDSTYKASITFMVKEDEGNSVLSGTISAIMGNFGFGGGSRSKFNLDKVVALSTSNNIIQKALFDSLQTSSSSKELIADFIIKKYDFIEKWKKSESLISTFKGFETTDSLSIIENAALKSLINLVSGSKNKDKLFSSTYSEESTILSFNVNSISDTISLVLAESIYKHLQDFYIFQGIEKAQQTVKNLETKVGVLEKKLGNKEYNLARTKDQNLGIWQAESSVYENQISRDVNINSVMYAELVKNLETARFSLENATPVFQLIDKTDYPIQASVPSVILYILIGFVIGFLIIFSIVFFKFLYLEA